MKFYKRWLREWGITNDGVCVIAGIVCLVAVLIWSIRLDYYEDKRVRCETQLAIDSHVHTER